MPSPSLTSDLLALENSLASLRALLASFQSASRTTPHGTPHPPQIASPPNPLALLSDAAQLLKAQTTKLSLLILNKPFSAREVNHILSELSKSILPALMSGSELLHPETYTKAVHEHVRGTLGMVWRELMRLLECVPTDAGLEVKGMGEAALSNTGVLWEQCDELISLGETGVKGVVDKRVKGYGELLDDAIAEIDEWDPDDGEEEDDDHDDNDEHKDGGGEEGNKEKSPQIALKAKVLKFLRLLRLLYPALRKRRIKSCPNITRASAKDDIIPTYQVRRLDQLVGFAQQFSEETDELAGLLYADESGGEVDNKLYILAVDVGKCALLMETDWNGQEDEFCTWLRICKDVMRQPRPPRPPPNTLRDDPPVLPP